jgi:transcription termination factor Rho
MIERLKNRATVFALLAAGLTALGVGGVAIAQSGGGGAPAKATQEREADQPGDKGDANEKGEQGDDANERGERAGDREEKGDKTDAGERGEHGDADDGGSHAEDGD